MQTWNTGGEKKRFVEWIEKYMIHLSLTSDTEIRINRETMKQIDRKIDKLIERQ